MRTCFFIAHVKKGKKCQGEESKGQKVKERDGYLEMAGREKKWKRSPTRAGEGDREQCKREPLWISMFVYGVLDVKKTIF